MEEVLLLGYAGEFARARQVRAAFGSTASIFDAYDSVEFAAQKVVIEVPLVIMAATQLTLIGIAPGHALLGGMFTAVSWIGMIALAAIAAMAGALFILDDPNSPASQSRCCTVCSSPPG